MLEALAAAAALAALLDQVIAMSKRHAEGGEVTPSDRAFLDQLDSARMTELAEQERGRRIAAEMRARGNSGN